MATVLKGAPVASALSEDLAVRTRKLTDDGITPCMAIVRVGERADDLAYEQAARKRCEKIGISVRQFVLPADVKVKERLEARCPSCLIHICGKTDKLVSTVAEARMGVFSVDSIDMVKAQQDSQKRCALFGNLSPAQILAARSAEEVYVISKELCTQMKPFGGFILAPGCDLAPNIPLENLQAMAKAAREI